MSDHPSISVVVPCYKSVETLVELCDRLMNVLSKQVETYEIILVNDGSPDDTWSLIHEIVTTNEHVKGINLMRNYGQHNATLCGIRAAKHDAVITIDDDLQSPPEEIPKLLAAFKQNNDVVYGVRSQEAHGILRNLASIITKIILSRALGKSVARNLTSFRIFQTSIRDSFQDVSGHFVFIDVMLAWGAKEVGAVEVDHLTRKAGRSNYTMRMLFQHSINMLAGFSTIPLQIASILGFIMTTFGMILLIYVLGRYFFWQDTLEGFTFLASAIVIFAGTQMILLGIIGEYIARMYVRILGKPAYTVDVVVE